MLVLGSWAVTNIITGAIASNTNNRELHYFHQMNMIWNGVNLLFAGSGYYAATHKKNASTNLWSVLQHQHTTEKTFLFNSGLDLAYVAGGFYLKEKSKTRSEPAKLLGYGNSIVLQGGFLFMFDAIMYKIHQQHFKKMSPILQKLTVTAAPSNLLVAYRL